MKTPSDDLFNIIKSLTREEKILFKVFCKQKSENANYLLMFDSIDALKDYSEAKLLIIWFKKGGSINIKDAKKYLKEVIFMFLEYHHFDYSIGVELQRYLQRIELLFDKGLIFLAKKQVIKAEQMAIDHQQHPYLFMILQWKRKIEINNIKNIDFENNELQSIDLYRNFIEYQRISIQVFKFSIIQGHSLNKDAIIELKKMLKNPYLLNENEALSIHAKYFFWRTLGDIHLILKSWKKATTYFKTANEYITQSKFAPVETLNLNIRLIRSLSALRETKELMLLKDSTENFIASIPQKRLTSPVYNMYISIINNYIDYNISSLNINEALLASAGISELVEKRAQTQNYIVFYFHLFLIQFLKINYRQALQQTNRVLSKEKTGIREDVVSCIKTATIVLHYELGNHELLSKLCKSNNYFNKAKAEIKTVSALRDFFGNIDKKNITKKGRTDEFIKLKNTLELYRHEEINHQFDFISWAESKIQKQPMIEILRKKTNNQ